MIGMVIKRMRLAAGMTQSQLGEKLGIGKSSISEWESGKRSPDIEALNEIAAALNTTAAAMFVEESSTTLTHPVLLSIRRKRVPLLGSIAAGVPIYAGADHESYTTCDDDVRCDFALRVEGDSMIGARILDGDIVFIREQPDVEDGEIAAIIIDDSVTLKRVYHIKNGLQLLSENPKYRPMIYTNHNSEYLRILGKAVAFQSDVR